MGLYKGMAVQACINWQKGLEKDFFRQGIAQPVLIVYDNNRHKLGALAQLVERCVRNAEASGSNPLCSTKSKDRD